MRSLRTRLTLVITGVLGPLMIVLAVALYATVAESVRADFDRELLQDARVMSDLIEYEGDRLELELGPMVEGFNRRADAETKFRLWADRDGAVSPLFPDPDGNGVEGMPTSTEPVFADAVSPSGQKMRTVGFRFTPSVDLEDAGPHDPPPPTLAIVVARETRTVDALLADLARWFWIVGTAVVVLGSIAAGWSIRRAMAPVERLSGDIAALDHEALGHRLDEGDLPSELVPLVRRLNGMLGRLEDAFTREREFTDHVAHELRTPLSVLSMGLEMALRRVDPDHRPALEELLETTRQTSSLISSLLLLARAGNGAVAVRVEEVGLARLVDERWRAHAEVAASRELRFRNELDPEATVQSDPDLLATIITNVLSNAASYTEVGGEIVVRGGTDATVLEVWDSGPALDEESLGRVFDRFWRADEARTAAGEHAGVGLSLARELAALLQLELRARRVDGGLAFELRETSA